MKTKIIGIIAFICLLLTILWLVLLISWMAMAGPLNTFNNVLTSIDKTPVLFYSIYINVTFVTITVIMLFALFYQYYKSYSIEWATIAILFIPVYGTMALIAYLSQITIIPYLFELHSTFNNEILTQLFLRQTIQIWKNSAIAVINNIAYAVLGIPSIIFGILMYRYTSKLRFGGILLALNGIACILGIIGISARLDWLSQGSLVGGILFLLALIPISRVFLFSKT